MSKPSKKENEINLLCNSLNAQEGFARCKKEFDVAEYFKRAQIAIRSLQDDLKERSLNMSKPYWHCNECNGNFDHGEKCDCQTNENDTGPVLKVSESFIVSIDISKQKDISCAQIARRWKDFEIINTYYGEEAEKIYDILTNRGGVKL